MADERIAVRLLIRGRVQGVGYRAWLEREARARGLAGFVRNRYDGSVEAVAIGGEGAVGSLIEACRQGPPAAAVEAVDRHAATPAEVDAEGFRVLPTA